MSLRGSLLRLRNQVEITVGRSVLSAPDAWVRAAAGSLPRRPDGVELDPVIALALSLRERIGRPPIESLSPPAARREFAALSAATDLELVELAKVEDVTFPSAVATPLAARIYRPTLAPRAPALLFFHGGGFVVGDLDTHDRALRRLAAKSGVVVVSALYRLAPEHPFPAACDDAWAALRWVSSEAARLGLDPARIAVGGDSAGGNLAAGVAHRAAKEGGPKLAAQLLVYPGVDMRRTMASHRTFGRGFGLTTPMMDYFLAHYLRGEHDRDDPRASPIREASFAGLAPAIVAVAGFDPLRDEGLAYADHLRDAGVAVELLDPPRLIHGFLSMGGVVPAARDALDELAARLAKRLA